MPELVNWRLLSHPMNWLIVGATFAIWLLACHVAMQGFTALQGKSATTN